MAFLWSFASPANAQDLGGLFKQLEDTLNSANQGQTNQSSNSSGGGAAGGLGGLLNSLKRWTNRLLAATLRQVANLKNCEE